ncbi:putative DNA breaking-rejoining enzyme [Rhizoctonia solani 123E]|uniref:Putative DNA breaking-rejoining enzyme n=1 Tax=Rhizoctonia solani 123E TaxID=1423351 RepID=A0A074RIA2_9AGAM|nr:putative DNA breaking-rejoining enzyme [Rhizoctonia solani 123E]
MDHWKAAARRQAASRSKYLYATTQSQSSSPDSSPLDSPRYAPDSTQHVSRASKHKTLSHSHRFTPYSLTPSTRETQTKFSATTTAKLEQAMDRGLALRTKRNYSSFINQFVSFCRSEGLDETAIFPAEEITLCAFISSFTGEKSGGTASSAIAALKAWHRLHGLDWKGGYLRVAVLAPPTSRRPPRPPVTLEMLQALRSHLDFSVPLDTAVFAAALVAFWGQCRLGELLGTSRRYHDSHAFPSRNSLSPSIESLLTSTERLPASTSLRLPRTKTHQISGEPVCLTTQQNGLSPIRALFHLMHATSSIPSTHHLFAYTAHDGLPRCLTREDFLNRCNAIWSRAGFSHISGHSFRIGGTHAYLTAGVSSDLVKKMGRWSSDAFLKYWRSLETIVSLHAQNIKPSTTLYVSSSRPIQNTTPRQ